MPRAGLALLALLGVQSAGAAVVRSYGPVGLAPGQETVRLVAQNAPQWPRSKNPPPASACVVTLAFHADGSPQRAVTVRLAPGQAYTLDSDPPLAVASTHPAPRAYVTPLLMIGAWNPPGAPPAEPAAPKADDLVCQKAVLGRVEVIDAATGRVGAVIEAHTQN